MIFVITPPTVSIPSDNGVASIKGRPSVSLENSPQIMPPHMAAPVQTASSGFIPVLTSFPLKKSFTIYYTFGIRDEPPTRTISSISVFFRPLSSRAIYMGWIVFLKRSEFNSSNLARVSTSLKSYPSVRSSISILTSCVDDSARFCFSISLFSF